MKLQFNKLETTNDTIQVSWDGGNTWNSFPVSSAKENGITFSETDCPNISLIKVKGKFTTISNLDFVATAKEDNSEGFRIENFVYSKSTRELIKPEWIIVNKGNDNCFSCCDYEKVFFNEAGTFNQDSYNGIRVSDELKVGLYNLFCGSTYPGAGVQSIADYAYSDPDTLKILNKLEVIE